MSSTRLDGAIILAGGDSKRLGRPKPILKLGNMTLIERLVDRLGMLFNRITLVTDRPELFAGLPVSIIGDRLTGYAKSPLRGIHAGLIASELPLQFVTACDMPFLNMDLIKYMASVAHGYDIVVPRIGNYLQPLHAFYRRTCADLIQEELNRSNYKVAGFFWRVKVRHITLEEINRFDPKQRSFYNINTWADYAQALRFVEELEGTV